MRSDKEIDAEVALLKQMQPFIKNTSMAPNNREKIAAQIKVLSERMTAQRIEREYYCDETSSEYEEGDNDVWSEAEYAWRWMHEQEDQAMSDADQWGGLAANNGWQPKKKSKR